MARRGSKKKASQELEMARMIRRYDLAKWTLPPLIWIASTWVPLKASLPIAKALAGEDTSLTVTFSITIVVSLVASGAVVAMTIRAAKARAEIKRLRGLIEELETEKEKG
ncbi:MAG TPA: hypothetical protein VIE64_04750 [Solirubrobacterales bacterium]